MQEKDAQKQYDPTSLSNKLLCKKTQNQNVFVNNYENDECLLNHCTSKACPWLIPYRALCFIGINCDMYIYVAKKNSWFIYGFTILAVYFCATIKLHNHDNIRFYVYF